MSKYEISNLENLLIPALGGSEFVSASIKSLTCSGENYSSTIFAVEVTSKNATKQKKILLVAKMLPQNAYLQKLFNSQKTFRNEVSFYQIIAPHLRQFQKDQGLTQLLSPPDFYGARLSLDPSSTEVDEDAVLLIKNIKEEGFTILDRRIGFDLEQTKMILEKMAELHGTFLGFKTRKPDVFEGEFAAFFEEFDMYEKNTDAVSKMTDYILDLIKEDEFCAKNSAKIRAVFEENLEHGVTKNRKDWQKSPFVSIVHTDMWTNNIMVKLIDGKIVDVKFVDYQNYEYSSLARDVIFFLFSSVQLSVIQKHFDNFLAHYYDSFIKCLKKLKLDVSVFTFEVFLDEVALVVKRSEFFHVMLMLRPIYILDEDTKEVENLERNDFFSNKVALSEECKPKAYFIVKQVFKRGWI